MSNTTDGHELLAVCVQHRFDSNGVDHRCGFHAGHLVPATSHPVPRFIVFDKFRFCDPLWLLHSIAVWNVDPKRKAVFSGKRPPVPCIGEHDALIGVDEIERNRFIESIDGADLEKSGLVTDTGVTNNPTTTDS